MIVSGGMKSYRKCRKPFHCTFIYVITSPLLSETLNTLLNQDQTFIITIRIVTKTSMKFVIQSVNGKTVRCKFSII